MAEVADFSMSLGTTALTNKEGSVTWHYYDSLDGLGLTSSSTDINTIISKLPDKSTLTLVITSQSLSLPEASGLLEIRKSTNTFVSCLFTTLTGSYTGVAQNGQFKGWMLSAGGALPTGSIVAYSVSSAPPTGWLKCNGTSYLKTTYPGLVAVIGTVWGGDSTRFNVPDLRGQFLRAWDDSKGIDSGRLLQVNKTLVHRTLLDKDLWKHGHRTISME